MNFSNNYLFYIPNRALQDSITHAIDLLGEDFAKAASPDHKVTVVDNFLFTRGNYEQHRFSSNVLESLRDALEAALTEEPAEREPVAWAESQNNLGNILAALGQQKRDIESYEKAIQCFHHALEVIAQEESPLDWAATQSNLGTALQALGRQESDTKILSKSIDAYTAALLVYTRKETPEEWSLTMHLLGATFHTYGRHLKGNRTFQKSVVAYKNALAEFDADNYAIELMATHNNRAAVLHHLGESEENPDRLKEAIRSFETALTICMEQQLPFHLAVICRVNKATAQNVLAELTKDAMLAEEVADEFEIILECFPHALQPLCVKHCEAQLSHAQSMLSLN
jgi:tetratricopeptide (TPR) repeat protein